MRCDSFSAAHLPYVSYAPRVKQSGFTFQYWFCARLKEIGFEAWLEHSEDYVRTGPRSGCNIIGTPQHGWLTDSSGSFCTDYIGKYEELDMALKSLSLKIGRVLILPRIGTTRKQDYRSVYSSDMVDLVHQRFRIDIDTFGYQFE